MTRRRLLGCLTALALTAAVAGCGGARPQSPTTAVTIPVAPGSAPAAAAPAPAKNQGPAVSTPVSNPAPAPAPAPAAGGVNPVSVAPAPPPQQTAQVQTVAFTTVDKGTYSGVPERKAVLVTDAQAWEALWRQHTSRVVNGPGAPAIDFSQQSVLAVYMGEQRTGGYSIEVTSITRENGRLTVTVRQSRPGPGAITTMALTQPFHMVRIPKVPAGTAVEVNWQ